MATASLFMLGNWLPERYRTLSDHGETLRARIFLLLILICIVPLALLSLALMVILVAGHAEFWKASAVIVLATVGQSACLGYFLKTGNLKRSTFIYIAILFSLVWISALYTGGWHSPMCNYMLVLPLLACLIVSRLAGIVLSVIVLALYTSLFLMYQHNIHVTSWIADNYMPYMQIGLWFTTLLFLAGGLLVFDKTTEDLSLTMQLERQQWQHDLEYDGLTACYNLDTFLSAARTCQESYLLPDAEFAVFYIQVSNLKDINQRFGFEAGDRVLKQLASNLRSVLPDDRSLLARYSPNSFVVYLYNITDLGAYISTLYAMKKMLRQAYTLTNGIALTPELKLGSAITDEPDIAVEDLIALAGQHADSGSRELYLRKWFA